MIKIIADMGKRSLISAIWGDGDTIGRKVFLITDGSYDFKYEMKYQFNFGSRLAEVTDEDLKNPTISNGTFSFNFSQEKFHYCILYFNKSESEVIEFAKIFEKLYDLDMSQIELILACKP